MLCRIWSPLTLSTGLPRQELAATRAGLSLCLSSSLSLSLILSFHRYHLTHCEGRTAFEGQRQVSSRTRHRPIHHLHRWLDKQPCVSGFAVCFGLIIAGNAHTTRMSSSRARRSKSTFNTISKTRFCDFLRLCMCSYFQIHPVVSRLIEPIEGTDNARVCCCRCCCCC
jgi:hypothetical protein